MDERHKWPPAEAKHGDERGWRDHLGVRTARSANARHIPTRCPREELRAQHEMRGSASQDERTIGEIVERRVVVTLRARVGIDAFQVKLRVDRVGPAGPRELEETDVILAATERARTVPGGERRDLVEKEELGEPPRLQQRLTVPTAELQLTRDPALAVVTAANLPVAVVETTAVAVDQPARRIRDELAERRDAVLEWHEESLGRVTLMLHTCHSLALTPSRFS
jgi:hypothetical protein